ncbi:hypothetical protein AGLY_012834 [Aphis glycines]|uniref:Uncharacterized protein n=1 Tax=Aphis glycines TaxID=307491 RepID=A0A6G0T8E4_APHGL|nr:hypothetical protein AGLY_012834 [Aphis glycines]
MGSKMFVLIVYFKTNIKDFVVFGCEVQRVNGKTLLRPLKLRHGCDFNDSERSDKCIDFTTTIICFVFYFVSVYTITCQNNAFIQNIRGGSDSKVNILEYYRLLRFSIFLIALIVDKKKIVGHKFFYKRFKFKILLKFETTTIIITCYTDLIGTARVFIENSFGCVYYFFTRRSPTKKHIALCSITTSNIKLGRLLQRRLTETLTARSDN